MKLDYLWDGSGDPDPEIQELEKILAPLRFAREEPEFTLQPEHVRQTRFRALFSSRYVLALASVVLTVCGAWWFFSAAPSYEVVRLAGSPQIGTSRLSSDGRLKIGQWLRTDASSRARIQIGLIGQVDIEPNTRIKLVEAEPTAHRLQLERGILHATIWAPPRVFFVDTPFAEAVDLGCVYTLEVADDGAGILRVTYGWVAFKHQGRESFVPAGALCRTIPGVGPGTPFRQDASPEFQSALEKIDTGSDSGSAALIAVLLNARKEDTLTLWHLLARTGGIDRSRTTDRLAELVPMPQGVTRQGILAGDPRMLDLWWGALGLGNIGPGKTGVVPGSPNAQLPVGSITPVAPASSAPEQSGHTIVFRVLDAATGRGIAGATLTARQLAEPVAEMVADRDGRCVFSVAVFSAVVVRAVGYVSRMVLFRPDDAYPAEYTFKLEKGIAIGGYVQSEDGKPIRDAKINIRATPALSSIPKPADREVITGMLEVQTDASGHWLCNELPSAVQTIDLTLTHAEHLPCRYTTDPAPRPDPDYMMQSVTLGELKAGSAVLRMKPGFLITGTVIDIFGKGIDGVQVVHIVSGVPISNCPTFTTTSGGGFSFPDAGPGRLTLAVQAMGYAPAALTLQAAPGMPPVIVRLEEGQIVRGRVVDEEGKPVAGAQVIGLPGVDYGIPWKGNTDAEGRFLRDSAPAKPQKYGVVAEGFHYEKEFVLEPGKENEIRLLRLLTIHVSGKVIDSRTKMPIDRFRVMASSDDWKGVDASAEGRSGEFVLLLNDLSLRGDPASRYSLRVEAEGYRPDLSQSVEFQDGDRRLEIALVRADGLSGVVRTAGGEAVAGAHVFLCGGQTTSGPPNAPKRPAIAALSSLSTVRASSGRLFNASVDSDQAGKFAFDPMPEAHTVVATHEKGFAVAKVDQFPATVTLDLEPWGRIDGVLRVGSKPGANQRVTLESLVPAYRPPALDVRLSALADTEGKFSFPTVPPGEYRISHVPTGIPFGSQYTVAAVRAGETAKVMLGGMGRPVIGHVVIAGLDSQPDWSHVVHTLVLKLPDAQVPSRADLEAYNAWAQTEEGRNRLRSQRQYGFRIEADGSFRVEDVQAGTYIMNILLPLTPGLAPATVKREIVVPEMPGGRSDTPLDLGVLTLQIPGKENHLEK